MSDALAAARLVAAIAVALVFLAGAVAARGPGAEAHAKRSVRVLAAH